MEEENIISTLCEARLIRSKQMLSNYNAKDIADLIFLYFLLLTILKKDFNAAPIAAAYAKTTLQAGNWDNWRFSYNDLGMMIHTLFGKKNQREQLRDQEQNKNFYKKISFKEQDAKNWLRDAVRGLDRGNRDQRFLLNLERGLQIDNSNYRSIRRLVPNWQNLTHGEKSLVVTRLLHAFRIRARKSELFLVLDALAKANNLEIKNTVNPEKQSAASDEKASLMKRAATSAGLSVAAVGIGGAHGMWRAKKKSDARRANYGRRLEEEELNETSTAGSVSSASIASVPFNGNSQGYVRRQDPVDYRRLRKNDKNKDAGMGVAFDPIIKKGEEDKKRRRKEQKD